MVLFLVYCTGRRNTIYIHVYDFLLQVVKLSSCKTWSGVRTDFEVE